MQEIVHTLLFEEYGVSKKCVIIMDRSQMQLRLQQVCQKFMINRKETTWQRRRVGASLVIGIVLLLVAVTRVHVHFFL